jgi:pimeloyl-ACP methyl ester carboxylesterase
MPYVTATAAPTTELYYEELGQGPVVVLIHGWPLSHRMWEGQVNALVTAGYRCVAYDRRGFGSSGRPPGGYDYDTFASDLNDLLTALDLRDVTLAGFSMGGGEVARYIGRYGTGRVRKAMLIGAVPPFLLKTPDNPGGVDRSVFDGMIAGVTQDRIGFLADFVKGFFNWTPGSGTPHDDVVAYSKAIAWTASRARRPRSDRALRGLGQAVGRDDRGRPARSGEGRPARAHRHARCRVERVDAGLPEVLGRLAPHGVARDAAAIVRSVAAGAGGFSMPAAAYTSASSSVSFTSSCSTMRSSCGRCSRTRRRASA